MAARGSHWSFLEKARFEQALQKHGLFARRIIIDTVAAGTEKQVNAYAERYRRRKKLGAKATYEAYRDSLALTQTNIASDLLPAAGAGRGCCRNGIGFGWWWWYRYRYRSWVVCYPESITS